MTIEEIKELLELKGWTKSELARRLSVGYDSIYAWLHSRRNPSGPASILMRQWLAEERSKRATTS